MSFLDGIRSTFGTDQIVIIHHEGQEDYYHCPLFALAALVFFREKPVFQIDLPDHHDLYLLGFS